MPNVFQSHPNLETGKTSFLGVYGKDYMFSGKKGVQFKEVTDGSSNTIFLVEVADDRAVIWTKPEDLNVDPAKPKEGLANRRGEHFIALFVDGSVRSISQKIDPKTLHGLFTRNGAEVIQDIP